MGSACQKTSYWKVSFEEYPPHQSKSKILPAFYFTKQSPPAIVPVRALQPQGEAKGAPYQCIKRWGLTVYVPLPFRAEGLLQKTVAFIFRLWYYVHITQT